MSASRSGWICGIAGLVLMCTTMPAVAQQPAPTNAAPQGAAAAEMAGMPAALRDQQDAQIARLLQQVSAQHIQATIEKLVSFGTRITIGPADTQTVSQVRGIGVAREWIKSQFESYSKACGGCLEVKEDRFTQQPGSRIPQPTELVNIYAVMKGTDPEASKHIVLVTGHYDSIPSFKDWGNPEINAPGANDDGSGTAVSLECARVLSQGKFPGTIIFLTVPGEEQGLYGSKHFAQMAKEQGWQLDAVLNNDIVGGDKSPGQDTAVVRVFSEGIPAPDVQDSRAITMIRNLGAESDSPSRELARYIREMGATYSQQDFQPMLIFRPDRYLRGGDHTSFNQEGFAAVRFTEYRENYNHQHQTPRTENGIEYGDLPKFVDFDYIAHVARLNAATLASLASAPPAPQNVHIETMRLENGTTLKWDASPGAAEYEIVWRPTTSPDWVGTEKAGNATSFTIDRSKDNVIFGVRAVDAQGHRSLAVLPTPERRPAPAPPASSEK
ncbi:MAG: M20/M25/M40 family metallo-hydrolase [Terriglobales bacterium]